MHTQTGKYKIFSLTMALLMFVTSVGFSLDMHYCNGELKSVSLFGEAKSCHDTSQTCPFHKEMEKDRDCCENKQLVFQADIDKDLESNASLLPVTISQELTQFIVVFTTAFLDFLPEDKQKIVSTNYSNPAIHRDIYVLLETFLL